MRTLGNIPRWRSIVGGVETAALEYNPNRKIYFMQGFFAALWTTGKRFIIEVLLLFELDSAIVTMIRINRHNLNRPFFLMGEL